MEQFRLRVFRTVARHRNFRIAAEELHLTQPAVTQQIKALESELDTALFDREGGKVVLTAAGSTLLPYAERLASERGTTSSFGDNQQERGALSLGASK